MKVVAGAIAYRLAVAKQVDRRPKRVNFTSVQNSRTTHGLNYTPLPVRTGYERVLAFRSDENFAKTAREDGVVKQVKDKVIIVEFKDGSIVSYEIGRKFGMWAGKVQPHNLVTTLKEGERFKKGDLLIHNTNFFEKDVLNPGTPILKYGCVARVAFMESNDSFEDSNALSRKFSNRMTTNKTTIRSIKVEAAQQIHGLVKVGDEVDYDSILCTIHNQSMGNSDLFDENALATLKMLEDKTPRSKAKGIVEKIEVIYSGDVEEMSESVRQIVDKSDRQLYSHQKLMGKPTTDGRVDIGYRLDGKPMGQDMVAIKVYITGIMGMVVADKIVFANQMKSVNARIWEEPVVTEDGVELDAFFGYQSLANRIVLSPEEIGTTTTLCLALTEMAIAAYDS